MLFYALIGSSLVLLGIAGLQFTYMFYLERLHGERKKHITVLERKCIDLGERLKKAESRLASQQDLIDAAYPELGEKEDWADLIEER